MDYYQTLGVNKDATPEQIKTAYRKLAAKYHPDRGGDTAKFQEIQAAYSTLSDPQKKAEYDNPQPSFAGNQYSGFEDIFGGFGFGGFHRAQRVHKNKTISIRVDVSLKEIFTGKEIIGSIRLPSGKDQALQLKIPPGVTTGDNIRFKGLGDDSFPNLPRGDLIAQIFEKPDPTFFREGANLIHPFKISTFDAILGTTIRIMTPDDKQLDVNVPAGIQPGQLIKCNGYGLPKGQTTFRGDLYIRFDVSIPKGLTEEDRDIIKTLKQKYNQ